MKILVSYRGIPQSPGWATGDFVVNEFRNLGHEVTVYGNYYQTDKQIENNTKENIFDNQYDLALFMECNDADPQYLELTRANGLKTKVFASWFFDTTYYKDNLVGLSNLLKFDVNFIANPLELEKFNNSKLLLYALDNNHHHRVLKSNPNIEVSLFGSIRPDRKRMVTFLKCLGVDMSLSGGVFREQYIDALNDTLITVNQNPNQGRGLLNMRTFEAPACGSYLFLQNTDYVVNQKYFDPHGLCSVFSSNFDLARKIKTLLRDRSALDQRRKDLQEYFIDNHTYAHRCKEILSQI